MEKEILGGVFGHQSTVKCRQSMVHCGLEFIEDSPQSKVHSLQLFEVHSR